MRDVIIMEVKQVTYDIEINNEIECLFYCKGTDVRASGMFYTRCKSKTRSWKERVHLFSADFFLLIFSNQLL